MRIEFESNDPNEIVKIVALWELITKQLELDPEFSISTQKNCGWALDSVVERLPEVIEQADDEELRRWAIAHRFGTDSQGGAAQDRDIG